MFKKYKAVRLVNPNTIFVFPFIGCSPWFWVDFTPKAAEKLFQHGVYVFGWLSYFWQIYQRNAQSNLKCFIFYAILPNAKPTRNPRKLHQMEIRKHKKKTNFTVSIPLMYAYACDMCRMKIFKLHNKRAKITMKFSFSLFSSSFSAQIHSLEKHLFRWHLLETQFARKTSSEKKANF